MKFKIKRSTLVVVIVVSLLFVTQFVYGSNKEPGSSEDPIVTLSYVEQRIGLLEQKIVSLEQELQNANQTSPGTGKSSLEVVELKDGQRLMASAGTEIILRGGTAVAIQGELGGLSDVTGAEHIRMDEPISLNHLLIVPRNDGRGVRATTDAIFMVRGEYQVK